MLLALFCGFFVNLIKKSLTTRFGVHIHIDVALQQRRNKVVRHVVRQILIGTGQRLLRRADCLAHCADDAVFAVCGRTFQLVLQIKRMLFGFICGALCTGHTARIVRTVFLVQFIHLLLIRANLIPFSENVFQLFGVRKCLTINREIAVQLRAVIFFDQIR